MKLIARRIQRPEWHRIQKRCGVHWRLGTFGTFRLGHDGHHIDDDILKCILLMQSNWKYVGFGSDNGLLPNRHQAINQNIDDPFQWLIYASTGLNEITWHLIFLTMIRGQKSCGTCAGHGDGLIQYCTNSIANALEFLLYKWTWVSLRIWI